MATYPKVKSVTPLSGKQLFVTFITGDTRGYDCAPLLNESSFYSLKDDAFFKNVHVDQTGYGVVWNDNVDLRDLANVKIPFIISSSLLKEGEYEDIDSRKEWYKP